MAVKVVSFDVDGTLVEPTFVDLFWQKGIPELYAAKTGLSYGQALEEIKRRYDEVGERDIRWYLPGHWFRDLGLEGDPREVIGRFKDSLRVYPEAEGVMERLHERYKLIVSSNAALEFLEIEVAPFHRYLSRIFSSTSHFGQVKKTPEFYTKVSKSLGIEPREMIHVGDHWEFDYLVPRKLGMECYYLDRKGKRKGEFILRDLEELEARL
ncbi:MAG: HAD family hydrolase [Candidatus Hydrothermarchaeota archaeon]